MSLQVAQPLLKVSGAYTFGSRRGFLDDIVDEDPYSQPAQASRRQYQWQLNDGQQWMSINNDHVIEAHYCQPGAKGITIFTSDYGRVFIDFDKMEVQGCQLYIRRQTFLAHDEMQEMGWYYNDNRRWYEYGSQGSSSSKASVSSSDLEQQYTTPQRNMRFTVGNLSYSLDIQAMTQTNLTTGVPRRVRRRPKLNSIIKINSPASSFQLPLNQQSASHIEGGWKWQFQADEGVWTDYNSPRCSVDSDEIERCYQRNPQGQVKFKSKRFSYTLHFTGMFQTNSSTGTQRSVRREQAEVQPTDQRVAFSPLHHPATPQAVTLPLPSSAGYTWEFMGDEGMWTEYQTPSCSIDGMEIERIFQLNSQGQTKFTAGRYIYTLDFPGMHQTNDILGTQRAVRRLLKNSPQLNRYNAVAEGVRVTPAYSSDSAGTQCRWQYKDVDRAWRDFVKGSCSVSSQDIENSYQQNPSGTMSFGTNHFLYELDFSAMTQTNQSTWTVRKVRRHQE